MRRSLLVIVVWAAVILQSYFFSALGSSMVVVNLAIILLILIAIKRSLKLALVLALWAGFWLDAISGIAFGGRMLLLVLTVLGVNGIKRFGFNFNRTPNLLVIVMVTSIVFNLALLAITWIMSKDFSWQWSVVGWWSIEAALTAAFAWLLGPKLQLIDIAL